MAGSRRFVSVRLRRRCRVQSDDASVFVSEGEEIAEGLGTLERGKPIRFTRNREVLGCLSREHDEDAGVRSTLVELACGMQVLWPISERGSHPVTAAQSATERLQCLVPRRRA